MEKIVLHSFIGRKNTETDTPYYIKHYIKHNIIHIFPITFSIKHYPLLSATFNCCLNLIKYNMLIKNIAEIFQKFI